MRSKKHIVLIFAILVSLALLITGCSKDYSKSEIDYYTNSYDSAASFTSNSDAMKNESYSSSGASYEEGAILDSVETVGTNVPSDRKIIENKYITMETKEFDSVIAQIEELVRSSGGYMQDSKVNGIGINDSKYRVRSAYYCLRIPSGNAYNFTDNLKQLGNVIEERSYMEDVTTQYYDLEARIKSLEVQEKRLLELLAIGEELEDILALESQLANVRYEIETTTARLKNLSNLVDYVTIQVSLNEVREITVVEKPPVTIGERISRGFTNSLRNIKVFFVELFIGFVTVIPYLLIYVVIGVTLGLLIRRSYKKIRRKKDSVPEKVPVNEEK